MLLLFLFSLPQYPKLFSGGFFSHEGPSKKQRDASTFSLTFHGKGFSESAKDQTKQDVSIVTKVSGPGKMIWRVVAKQLRASETSSAVSDQQSVGSNPGQDTWVLFHGSAYRKHRIGAYGSRDFRANAKSIPQVCGEFWLQHVRTPGY